MSKKLRKSASCYNCDTVLGHSENYCPNCGQENHSRQASTRILISDFLNDYLAFDSKLFRSVIPLVSKPGFITKEYLDGKRQRFIPPIRVFLFLSFIYFGLSFILVSETGTASVTFDVEDGEIAKKISDSFSKYFDLAVFFFTPILAWVIMLFYRSKEREYYVNFFVYSLHFLSFLFILSTFIMILFSGLSWIDNRETADVVQTVVLLSALLFICVYAVISLKKVFNKKYNILRFFSAMILAVVVFIIVLLLYLFFIAWVNDGFVSNL
ncbi:MAG: putative RNA-binding Zn-ribbon protein involved in translation (DUF1610 family) [Patiriisocius sp.]|jgi:predicted RNA-binding Zn-ribbon protein involved in translation (DUF1610 family)